MKEFFKGVKEIRLVNAYFHFGDKIRRRVSKYDPIGIAYEHFWQGFHVEMKDGRSFYIRGNTEATLKWRKENPGSIFYEIISDVWQIKEGITQFFIQGTGKECFQAIFKIPASKPVTP